MPNLSDRADRMPASPIRRLAPLAEAAAARGIRIYHLNIGQPDVQSPSAFWNAIKGCTLSVLEYSHAAGSVALRTKTAAYYRSLGMGIDPADVIVCTAGSEAVAFSFMVAMNPGDEVVIPEPLYANYVGFAEYAGVKVVPITTTIEDGFRLPGIEEFEKRVTDRTRAVLVCNPSNPTGAVYSRAQLEGLRDLALRHDLFLIGDEVYRDFNFTGEPVTSILQIEGLEQNAVVCDSVSKRFSLCGARVGFLVSKNRRFMDAALRFAQARLSPPTLEQIGVEAAMDSPPEFFDGIREEYRRRRDLLVSRLRAIPGVVVPEILGAFYAMVRLPIDDSDKFCAWMLDTFQHEGRTVMMAPGTGFYATPGLGKDEVRIAYVLEVERLEEAMDVLEAGLAAYPGRTNRQVAVGG
ncbi:MAG: pyridoxal phosphate-dependent aminotransferase [Fimbriimonadaceae bacterium]|nr:pyridoxal phosphate-dependent aminotransferase [Fimbriimonadaceae bacterium]QYK54766.1 MAG: pyridoxal phosphate-dependent aminotransferase [Fimbriimonadaceae bacterium]